MEQVLNIGDREICTFDFIQTKEVLVDHIVSFRTNKTGTIQVVEQCDQYFTWDLSQEELCTFIKLLVSHLELPLEFK